VNAVPPDPRRRNTRSYDAIMDATIGLLEEVGYQRLSVEAVAARAGVGKTTVYRWWPTKVRLAAEALAVRVEIGPVPSSGDLRSDVRALVEATVYAFTKSLLARALPDMATDLDDDEYARTRLVDWLGPARSGNVRLLFGAAGHSPSVGPIDAGLLLDLICGTVLYRHILGRAASDTMVEQLTALIVDGRPPRAASTGNRDGFGDIADLTAT
jgi:AcrR family transcriptional regulator